MPARYLEAAARLLVVGCLAIAAVVAPAPAEGNAPTPAAAQHQVAPAPAGADIAVDRHEPALDIIE